MKARLYGARHPQIPGGGGAFVAAANERIEWRAAAIDWSAVVEGITEQR
jgi:hypothetical protein